MKRLAKCQERIILGPGHMSMPASPGLHADCRQVNDFLNQFARYGLLLVSPNAAAFVHDVVVVHSKSLCNREF